MSTEDDGALAAVAARLDAAETLREVQGIVRSAARRLVRGDGATFVLRDDEACFYVDEDAMSPLWKGQRFPIASCISGWAMLHHTTAVIPDITLDDRIPQEAYRPTFVKSLVMVPIRVQEPIGAIGAYWDRPYTASHREVETLEGLASATATALDRTGLHDAPFLPMSLDPDAPTPRYRERIRV